MHKSELRAVATGSSRKHSVGHPTDLRVAAPGLDCYNPCMAKKEKTVKDKIARDKDTKPDEESQIEPAVSDSSSELEPVKSKKGEPADHLRRRAEWFQKRTGGG